MYTVTTPQEVRAGHVVNMMGSVTTGANLDTFLHTAMRVRQLLFMHSKNK